MYINPCSRLQKSHHSAQVPQELGIAPPLGGGGGTVTGSGGQWEQWGGG